MAANIPDPGGSDRSPANAISQHKTLMPVSSRPTCLPSTCAGSRSERNTNFKWDSAGLSGISGIPRGKRSCTPEGSLGHVRSKGCARLGHVRALEGSCRREMVSRAHTDDATPRAHPAHVARSLSPCIARIRVQQQNRPRAWGKERLRARTHDRRIAAIMAHKLRSAHRTMVRAVDGQILPFRRRAAAHRAPRARPARWRAPQSTAGPAMRVTSRSNAVTLAVRFFNHERKYTDVA